MKKMAKVKTRGPRSRLNKKASQSPEPNGKQSELSPLLSERGCWVSMAVDEGKVVEFSLFFFPRFSASESRGRRLGCWHALNGNGADKELKSHAVSVKQA